MAIIYYKTERAGGYYFEPPPLLHTYLKGDFKGQNKVIYSNYKKAVKEKKKL